MDPNIRDLDDDVGKRLHKASLALPDSRQSIGQPVVRPANRSFS